MSPEHPREITTALAIIGSGLAGCAAAIFAAERGMACAVTGQTGAVAYTTGYLDLIGRHDGTTQAVDDPWAALEVLRVAQPRHPLARVPGAEVRRSLQVFTRFLTDRGLAYTEPGARNLTALTPVGTTKRTLCMPLTMLAGAEAMSAGRPCVIVDVDGLKGFSGREFVANLGPRWPGLATRRIAFPGLPPGELHAEVMARALEVPATREALAAALREAAGTAGVVGLPAILGMHRPDAVHQALQALTGLTLFEIPTMPPAVPGIRLRELLEQALPEVGVKMVAQHKVQGLAFDADGATLTLADAFGPIRVRARAVLLASGRFLSGGLEARPEGVVEPLMGLPVTQPARRADWYRERYTDQAGHPVHRAGLEVDDAMRPLGPSGRPFDPRLFAAGSILAHHDWIRTRSGAAIAIATAWAALGSMEPLLR